MIRYAGEELRLLAGKNVCKHERQAGVLYVQEMSYSAAVCLNANGNVVADGHGTDGLTIFS